MMTLCQGTSDSQGVFKLPDTEQVEGEVSEGSLGHGDRFLPLPSPCLSC